MTRRDPRNPAAELSADPEPLWVTLPPNGAGLSEGLAGAINEFDAGTRPAARSATAWLRNHALASHRTTRTRLLLSAGRVEGFYSLASSQVELSQRDRLRADLEPVRVPAALITWIAKDRRSKLDGGLLLLHAAGTARRASELLAVSVLVVDPFDEDTARMWRSQYGFRTSADKRRPRRLWLPLDITD